MSPIFTVIVIILAVLAVLDLILGVSNDAVNFLNSALGSKVAKRWIILTVASVGIMVGVVTSNGMMEIARNGVFHPGMFTFSEVMMLFVCIMLTDVIVLNTFNNLGLPTSTTVSLIFELLGASLAVAVYKIWQSPEFSLADLGQFINTGKAMVLISGILSSVVISFTVGAIAMYISRIIFSFKYAKSIKRYGAIWCGLSIVGIVYFALFKGLKGSSLITPELDALINDHIYVALLIIWFVASLLLWIIQLLRINIMKVTILAGTFALALAFAGNDLVNFIGVPLAGIDSYKLGAATGNMSMLMSQLADSTYVNPWFLIVSGVIMSVTLFFSKQAMKVAETQLNLSSQNDEEERFGSTGISRALVSGAIILNRFYKSIMPDKLVKKIDTRFVPDDKVNTAGVSYDYIRAVVNLSAAACLICLGTSLKLPLSTTYVIFMVSMGSSLADRAWGRESAVYRITGVMVVIMGWFITALAAITISFITGMLLMWGGWIALAALVVLCGYILCHNLIFKKKEEKDERKSLITEAAKDEDILYNCTQEVCTTMEQISSIYNHMLVALFTENKRLLKETMNQSEALYHKANDKKHNILQTLKSLQDHNIETAHFYIQVVDYLCEVTKALLHCTRPAYSHIENHHRGFTKEQIIDLKVVNDGVDNIFNKINTMLRDKDFSDLNSMIEMRDNLFGTIATAIKNQICRLKEEQSSTKASMLYLNILNETKTMVLQSRNLIKSEGYFLSKISVDDKKPDAKSLEPANV